MYQRESYSFIHAVFMSLIFVKEILTKHQDLLPKMS